MITHHHIDEVLDCINQHLVELTEMAGGHDQAAQRFNMQTSTLFELVYDARFGIFLLRRG